jgi:2-oxoglutarate dehydrogenase E2 component (dihydrolipoamide succinyltransferase)
MATEALVPAMGESITEAVIVRWLKGDGDAVAVDEPICELETDKANVDLPSPAAGTLRPLKAPGATVRVGELIARIEDGQPAAKPAQPAPSPAAKETPPKEAPPKPPPASKKQEKKAEAPAAKSAPPPPAPAHPPPPTSAADASSGSRREPMSNIRRRIAERLVKAQQTAAMLTTFNEIDMTTVLELRARHQERFTELHGVPLGLMSFFVRAAAVALKQFPMLNAEIDGSDIVYHDHVHLGVAVSTERGLVVPVLRNVETMSFPQIETEIKRVATAAREGKLSLAELSGGTFTITNGGVFGSLLSTPILNPPQTGILGMHTIQRRPAVVGEEIMARPLMYVALTYDHRLVDGKDSVSFLVRIKKLVEDPMEMLLEM